jgi:hypothetical protein
MSTSTANPPLGTPRPRTRRDQNLLYESHKKIQTRSVTGTFTSLRWAAVWFTQILFYALPWFNWNGRQAVLFDLLSRRFYLGGLVLYPQDFIYLTGLLVMAALSLFLFTAVAGRLWCGYACPQTVYTEVFMWIEKKIEGDRAARIRLDDAPMSGAKFGRRAAKHGAWVLSRCGPASPSWATSADHRTRRQDRGLLDGAMGDVLGTVLRRRNLRQRRLHARAGLQVHVSLCALPERDVRRRHADHHV